MKWISGLRVSHKLMISFAVCLAFAIIAGVAGMLKMATMNQNTSAISGQAIAGIVDMETFLNDHKQYRVCLLKDIISQDPVVKAQSIATANARRADADKALSDYGNNATDEADKQNLSTLEADWNAAKSCQDEIVKAGESRDPREINKIVLVDSQKSSDDTRVVGESMVDWNVARARSLAAHARQTYAAACTVMISLLAAALALGLLLASLIIHDITTSLAAVSEKLRQLDRGFTGVAVNTDALAQGDFVHQAVERVSPMEIEARNEFGELAVTFNSMLEKAKRTTNGVAAAQQALSRLIGKIRDAAQEITASSGQLAAGNEDLATRTSAQAANLEQTAASMEQMTSSVRQSADNATEANSLALEARNVAQSGGQIVSDAVTSINELYASSQRISDIVSVIDEIAFQTNLLALNAAVEAARVGEQGRGFAVVASEVRSLASRSSVAAKEIKALVLDSVRKAEEGAAFVNKSGDQLVKIVAAVDTVAIKVNEITSAAREQSAGIAQVGKAVTELDSITQQNATLVEQAAAASQSMAHMASDMTAQVSKFRLDETQVERHRSATAGEPPLKIVDGMANRKSAGDERRATSLA